MLAVGGGDLLMMSTPWGKRGFFWDAWAKGGSAWERTSGPATECARIPATFLEEERATLGDRWFRQEYLCEFVATEDTLFDRDSIEVAVTNDVKPYF